MAESLFIRADEVIRLLGVSKSEAYRIIKRLNDEMASKGYIVINGRVNRRSFGRFPSKNQSTFAGDELRKIAKIQEVL